MLKVCSVQMSFRAAIGPNSIRSRISSFWTSRGHCMHWSSLVHVTVVPVVTLSKGITEHIVHDSVSTDQTKLLSRTRYLSRTHTGAGVKKCVVEITNVSIIFKYLTWRRDNNFPVFETSLWGQVCHNTPQN